MFSINILLKFSTLNPQRIEFHWLAIPKRQYGCFLIMVNFLPIFLIQKCSTAKLHSSSIVVRGIKNMYSHVFWYDVGEKQAILTWSAPSWVVKSIKVRISCVNFGLRFRVLCALGCIITCNIMLYASIKPHRTWHSTPLKWHNSPTLTHQHKPRKQQRPALRASRTRLRKQGYIECCLGTELV